MNDIMEVQQSRDVEVKSLVYRIVNDKKGYSKDERIAACEQLQQTLTLANDVANIGCDWKKLIEDLLYCLKTRQQFELKRCVSDCLGSLGCIMFSQYNEYLKLLLNEAKRIPDKYEDDKALILKAVFSSLNLIGTFSWQSRIRPQDVDALMTAMKNWLEVNDSSVVLIPLLDTCLAVSKYFPANFKHSFDDIVDFTVGWYIEPGQPTAVLNKCHQMLVELRPYWHSAVPSAITLMKQFLDDSSAYIEDIKANGSKAENILAKTAAILRALITMLEVMVTAVNPLVADFIDKVFGRIGGLSNHLNNVFAVKIGTVFRYMAEVFCIALKTYPRLDFLIISMKALKIMVEHPSVNEKSMIKILECSGKIIDNMTSEMVVKIVDYLIGDEPLNHVITRSHEVMQAYGDVLGKLLVPKNLSTLQVVYNRVREGAQNCFNMLEAAELEKYCSNTLMIKKKLMIYFKALNSLGVVKNSLIAMMGLSPSLFTFLMTETPITKKQFIINYPSCHYALLYIVKTHSEKHENFVANSSLLIDKSNLTLVTEPATAKYTTTILNTVTKLLALDDLLWTDTRNLLIDWIHGLVFSLTPDVLSHILDKPATVEMRSALLDSFVRHSLPKKTPQDNKIIFNPETFASHWGAATTSHRVRHFTLLRRLAVFNLVKNGKPDITAKFVRRIFEQCHSGCQNKITGIWQATPPVLFISDGLTECAQDLMEFGQQKIPESLFTPEHFKIIADFLLSSVLPTYCLNNIDDGYWISDTAAMIYANARGDASTNKDCISKWRWIIAQMAQFCVNNRLKTFLGKPLDTFLAFESEIRRLASNALLRKPLSTSKSVKNEVAQKTVALNRRNVVEDEDDAEVEIEREARQLTASEHWWRVRALLEMIEMLDKLIAYACYGAIFQLSTISQLSQQFLTTNQASCANWLSRLCLPMMAVAYTSSNFTQVVRLGGCSLKDIEKRIGEKGNKDNVDEKGEIDSVAHTCITWMVKALIDLGRPQAILGLYAWVKKIYGKGCVWIKCAAQMAAGRIEPALNDLQECMRNENLSENTKKTIRQLIIFGLEVLRNSEEIDVFWRTLGDVLDSKPDAIPDGFEEYSWKRMKSLTTFDNCLKDESVLPVPWDIRSSFVHTELKLMDIVHDRTRDAKDNKTDVVDLTRQLSEDARILMLSDTGLQTFTRASALHLLATAVKDSRKPYHKQSVMANVFDPSFLFDCKNGPALQRLIIGQQLSTWLQYTQIRENGGSSSLRILSNEATYYLEMARLARKTKNYRLAEKHIKTHYNKRLPTLDSFQLNILRGMQGNWISGTTDKEDKLTNNVQFPVQQRLYNFENLTTSYGFSKVMWAISETVDTDRARTFLQGKAFSLLMNAVADEIDRLIFKNNLMFNGTPTVAPDALITVLTQQFNHVSIEDSSVLSKRPGMEAVNNQIEQNKISAKAIIQLARWLQSESSLLPIAMSYSMRIAFHMFGVEQSQLPLLGPSGIIDSLAGAFLTTASKLSPHLAKAHLELGNWAFKRISDADNEIILSFINEERGTIEWQIKNACKSVEDSVIETLLQTMQKSTSLAAILPDCKAVAGKIVGEQTCDVLFGPGSMIQEIWKGANSRHLAFCNYAAHSYFAYIAVSGRETKEGSIGVVMATLRILQLLVKQYDALHHVILNEMLQVNELMWKDILPQLFARLNHPVRAVRDTVCTILERIAAASPHALCYPAIVGATQPIVIHNEYIDNAEVEKSDFVDVIDEEKKRADQDRSLMFECCERIVTRMQALFPDLVRDVTEFVKELQRIDMLHEERWTFVLTNLDLEMNRRILQIEAEMMKTLMNTHLNDDEKKEIMYEKTIIFTSWVYRIVEDLYEKTCTSTSVTVNEKQFQETYLTTIEEAVKTLRMNKSEPRQAWASFKLLLDQLNQRANRRSFVFHQMADISPRLAAINKTNVPLPGQEHKNFCDVVMLERISKQTVILPTKTRPRKIVFHGSDGKDYPFLFKGQEDLHLDERIMQLLRICNLMLSKKETDWPSYTAENYSVTPLGSRSGLIQWVEGATPLFQVYRKWQLHQAAENNANQKINEVERPSALFFRKLRAAFQANKIPKESIIDRQKWPYPILKSVVEDLIDETPRDLLSRELWLRSGSSDTWFRVTERFARSTAVMSVLGSILGLGDRHLDNVLVNFEFGHVVHIDYNVCFDKGRNLRVPEMVPFRLTGNIVRALGPTDVEGTFRLSSEIVLEKLRAGKNILLTMLDAFVYDPLVDWAAVQDDLGSKSMIGIATIIAVYGAVDSHSDSLKTMALSLFALRIRELSVAWLHNRDSLKCMLMSLINILEKLYENTQKHVETGPQNSEREINKLEMEKLSVERDLKNAVTEHHSMMRDLRPLLRSFAHKNELFAVYLQRYKELFSDPLIKGLKLMDDFSDGFAVCIDLFRSVIDNIPSIYDNLLLLDKMKEKTELPLRNGKSSSMHRHEGQQQQNLHGKHVSKRVRMKLEGMVVTETNKNEDGRTDANTVSEPLTPSKQIDLLIHQATDISNLALMYEGWTAWV